jgi:hypothetical protein
MDDFVSILNEYSLTHLTDGEYKEYEKEKYNHLPIINDKSTDEMNDIYWDMAFEAIDYGVFGRSDAKYTKYKYNKSKMYELIVRSIKMNHEVFKEYNNFVTEYIYNEYKKHKQSIEEYISNEHNKNKPTIEKYIIEKIIIPKYRQQLNLGIAQKALNNVV